MLKDKEEVQKLFIRMHTRQWYPTQVSNHEKLCPFSDNLTTLRFIVVSDLKSMYLRKSNVGTSQLDVQEADSSLTQFDSVRSHVFGTLVYVRTVSPLLIFAIEQTAVSNQLRCIRESIGVCFGQNQQVYHCFAHTGGRLNGPNWFVQKTKPNQLRAFLCRASGLGFVLS